jgi:hypothetical protein
MPHKRQADVGGDVLVELDPRAEWPPAMLRIVRIVRIAIVSAYHE